MSAVTLASCWRGTDAGVAAAHGEARLATSAPTSAAEEEVGLGISSASALGEAVDKEAVWGKEEEAPGETTAAAVAAVPAAAGGTKEEAVAEEERKDGCAAPFWATDDGVRKLAAVRPGEEDDGDAWAAVAAVEENRTVGWVTAAAEVEGKREKCAAPACEEVGEVLEVWLRRSSFLLVMSSCSCITACTQSEIARTMQTCSQCMTPTTCSWELKSKWSAMKLWRSMGAQRHEEWIHKRTDSFCCGKPTV